MDRKLRPHTGIKRIIFFLVFFYYYSFIISLFVTMAIGVYKGPSTKFNCAVVRYSQADAHSASTAWGFNLISHTKGNVFEINKLV